MTFATHAVHFQRLLILFIGIMSADNLAHIVCPKFVLIERGMQSAIRCNMTSKPVFGVYWYRGSTMTTSPLLLFESGKPGGSAYNTSDFDINSSGDMIIKNTTLGHEAVYTLVVYFQDRTFESRNVTVNVTIVPDHPCPRVAGCDSCENCKVNITGTPNGEVMCSIASSRPQILANWKVLSKREMSFVIHQHIVQEEPNAQLWETSVKISYESNLCGAEAVAKCMAQDDYGLLRFPSTTISIFNADCKEVVAASKGVVIVFSTIGIAVLLILILAIMVFYRQKASPSYKKEMDDRSIETAPRMPIAPEVSQLISCLKESYRKSDAIKVLPHTDHVPADVIYPPCQCKISTSEGETVDILGKHLLKDEYIKKRVLIINKSDGDLNTFVKQVVQQWIEEEENEFPLLFVPLNEVAKDVNVAQFLKDDILINSTLTIEFIEELIKQHECLVVLHRIHEMAAERQETAMSQKKNLDNTLNKISLGNVEKKITLEELLNGNTNQDYKNIHVWITSCEASKDTGVHVSTDVTVEINNCVASQIKNYINRTCNFYIKGERTTTNSPCNKGDENSEDQFTSTAAEPTEKTKFLARTEIDTDKDEKPFEELVLRVDEFFNKLDILDDFMRTPYLLMLLIHITVKNFLDERNGQRTEPIRSTLKLVEALIMCLKDVYYFSRSKKQCTPEEFNKLFDKIGDVAFKFLFDESVQSLEHLNLPEEYNDYVNTGLQVGLLQRSRENTLGNNTVFCHDYIQNYFSTFIINRHQRCFNKFKDILKSKKKNSCIVGVLRFSDLFETTFFKDLCMTLQKQKMFTDLITCLHGRTDQTTIREIVAELRSVDLYFSRLSDKNVKKALKAFCSTCRDINITLKSITFNESCDVEFFKNLKLPEINRIKFDRWNLKEEEFISLILWVDQMKRTRSIWFLECDIPQKVTKMSSNEVKQLMTSGLEVCRKKRFDDSTRSALEIKSGNWRLKVASPLDY